MLVKLYSGNGKDLPPLPTTQAEMARGLVIFYK